MYHQEATDEYTQALKQGQKELKALTAAGKDPYPAILDDILENSTDHVVQELGVVEIPTERIVGIKSAGRVSAFNVNFLPLLSIDSEFAHKWIDLCASHLDSEGIREPIICYEYLGNFYVQEGNKRVSVLKYFGAPRIPGTVFRLLPPQSEDPRIVAYYEFLDFYKASGLYTVQFRRPGDYAALLSHLNKEPGQKWDDREVRNFSAYFQYFREAFAALGGGELELLSEEALLLWLRVHPFKELGELSAAELKKSITRLWDDMAVMAQPEPVEVRTEPGDTETRPGILERIVTGTPSRVNVAFIHARDPYLSTWILGHEQGSQHLQTALGDQVTVRSYYHADTPQQAEALMEQAVAEGADVVFTTTPQLSLPTLRVAVKYPKVRFLNCSVDTPYSSIRTYYSRVYEAKFITGALAGAMAPDGRIGYVGSNPIFGVPASINAFALGAQLTNPRAKIFLRWSCLEGDSQADFLRDGIRVISNRDVPAQDRMYLDFCNYGTYTLDDRGNLTPIASPCWVWGKFYETVVRSILSGAWEKDKDSPRAVNYWWGMDSGVIDVTLSDTLPAGLRVMAELLRDGLRSGTLDPFRRVITAQDGTVKNDGTVTFTPDELLHMDWLCDNVVGSIPEYDQLASYARPMARALGIYRDRIPIEKEERCEDSGDI